MLSTIIVPLDGSDFAARALPHATALARSSGAKLVLVRVLTHRASGSAADEMEAIRAALNVDADAIRADGMRVETIMRRVHPVHADDVARAIAEIADDQQAELIVMSTHGRSGLGRWVYGSVADSVLQQSTTPVLLVSPHVDSLPPTDRRLRVLVPLDGSQLAEEAIEAADLLTGALDTELTVLQVVETPTYPLYGDGYAYVPYDQEAKASGRPGEYLQSQVDRLQAQDKRVTARATIGNPSWVIAQMSHEVEADVIVMATHGRTGLNRLGARQRRHRNPATGRRARPAGASGAMPARGRCSERLHSLWRATVATASPLTSVSAPTIDVRLSVADLELIERGLKTLAYMPG